ncbi:MAG: DNA replication/repair protein RecF [bacterium]|nr:DNA replication/repair protein RecF [bacterium]
MHLSRVELKNFRNYSKAKIKFNSHINIFIGDNAQGKTNILESIYILALTKSHRYGIEHSLIRRNYNSCFIKGTIKDGNKIKDLEVHLEPNKKRVIVNSKEIKKISEYVSNMKIIMFCPDDLDIIKGSPQGRRNLMNIQISQLFFPYIQYLNEYNKILKSRNEFLRTISSNGYTDLRYLDVLNQKLCERAVKIYRYRNQYLEAINQKIGDIYRKITSIDGLRVEYEKNIDFSDYNSEMMEEQIMHRLSSSIKREIIQGNTLYGPHRDDFSFYIEENDMRMYGSQGQQRMAIVAFKLAEIEIFKEFTGTSPILLLDDIFSELDLTKRQKLIQYIPDDVQTIITTTDLKNIKRNVISNSKVFVVEKGTIKERVK